MTKQNKLKVIITAGISLLAMLLLSSALSQTSLQGGKGINLDVTINRGGTYALMPGGEIFLYIIYLFQLASLMALIGLTIYMLLTPERRKKLLKFLLRAVPLVAMVLFLSNYLRSCSKTNTIVSQPLPLAVPTGEGTPIPAAVFTPVTSPWIVIVSSVVLALAIAGLALYLYLRFRQENARQTTPLLHLADKAQAALDSLQGGGDLKNAVLRCYFEMSRILAEQRGLKRDRAMTPHEFEALLVKNGMPGESVQMLTRLFEEVRYGTQVPGQREEWMAVTSLTAIVEACRRPA